jgi:hypothetical protein
MPGDVAQFEAEERRVEVDGVVLMCHHPRQGIWCCCAEEGPAQCCCGGSLDGAVRAWFRNERCGE